MWSLVINWQPANQSCDLPSGLTLKDLVSLKGEALNRQRDTTGTGEKMDATESYTLWNNFSMKSYTFCDHLFKTTLTFRISFDEAYNSWDNLKHLYPV